MVGVAKEQERFVREYGVHLHPWQLEVLNNWKGDRLLAKVARRTGKSFLAALQALESVRSGVDVILLCPNNASVSAMLEQFNQLRWPGRVSPHRGTATQFEMLHHNETSTNRIRVVSNCRGCVAPIGIVNEAAWVNLEQISYLELACQRLALFSSWHPNPEENHFCRLWRYGGLAWQRLEVPIDLDYGKHHADLLTDDLIYTELLRSPEELGKKPR